MSNAITTAINADDFFIECNEQVYDLTAEELAGDRSALLAVYLRREIANRMIRAPRISYEITVSLCLLENDNAVVVLESLSGKVCGRYDSREESDLDAREMHLLQTDSYFQG